MLDFLALASLTVAKLLRSTSLCEKFFDFSTPPRLTSMDCDSVDGMLESSGVSLRSLLKLGIVGAVADRINEIAPDAPREPSRACRSSVITRRRLLRALLGTGRFVTPPGRDEAADEVADAVNFGRAGDTATGPPSFRQITPHCSGNRAEKLFLSDGAINVLLEGHDLQGHNNLNTKLSEYISCMVECARHPARF